MMVKVAIVGEVAFLISDPRQEPRLLMQVPARQVRCRFQERAQILAGYFNVSEAVSRNTATQEEYPLDVLEIGERMPVPQDPW